MSRVKINFFDVLDEYEYWNGKCVKSVLGEFRSGVSIYRNKGTQSDLGAPFLPGVPQPGALPSALPTLGMFGVEYAVNFLNMTEEPVALPT